LLPGRLEALMEADHKAFAQRTVAIGAAPSRHSDIRSGDRVGLFMANYIQYLECFDRIWRVNLGRARHEIFIANKR
jgi:hypothetical protein